MGERHRLGFQSLQYPVIAADQTGADLPEDQKPCGRPFTATPQQAEEHGTLL